MLIFILVALPTICAPSETSVESPMLKVPSAGLTCKPRSPLSSTLKGPFTNNLKVPGVKVPIPTFPFDLMISLSALAAPVLIENAAPSLPDIPAFQVGVLPTF